ncbi:MULTISPECIES: hypothetical protein [Nostoc]|uniref:Uncharacterized protein n=2 Tax=Nostoc TaxID=1177 RepID=A0ABR8IIY1_9NOSO|nr:MULTISPECIES: hypothetical protein [Nostoc]MBD2564321.1 hypothetical protein [Nostoc linckia FACHB-391]MBD2650771.1 hypothetical protein [Nostoc foliaceum FACHB-393]
MSDYDPYSPTASTAYHRAAGASGQYPQISLPLRKDDCALSAQACAITVWLSKLTIL